MPNHTQLKSAFSTSMVISQQDRVDWKKQGPSKSPRAMTSGGRFATDAIFLMVFCTLFTSSGQILWKWGMKTIIFTQPLTFLNIPFLLGFVSYGLGAVFMIFAFQRGELSMIYPVAATSFVWVSLISPLLFPTDFMNVWKWAGVAVIVLSVSILGWGSSRQAKAAGNVPGDVTTEEVTGIAAAKETTRSGEANNHG